MKRSICLFILGMCGMHAFLCTAQGPLTPGAAPVPTMRTLDEVEPRGMIKSVPYVITQSGAYYFTTNLVCAATGLDGIDVQSDDVTIDMRGFTLYGPGKSSGNGIRCAFKNLTVLNGRVVAWLGPDPVGSNTAGINVSGPMAIVRDVTAEHNDKGVAVSAGARLETVAAFDNTTAGISAGHSCVFEACRAVSNGGDGLFTGPASVVARCTARGNGGNGIHTVANGLHASCTTIRECAAQYNAGDGILAENGGHVISCVTDSNGPGTEPSLSNNGIHLTYVLPVEGRRRAGSIVRDCAANNNGGNGILVARDTLLTGNSCSGNGLAVSVTGLYPCYAGIYAQGDNNRIENNRTSDNLGFIGQPIADGIRVDGNCNRIEANHSSGNTMYAYDITGAANFIARNLSYGYMQTCDYFIVNGNTVGPIIIMPVTGAIIPPLAVTTVGTTDPWANFDD
ncbi:MAG TPA: right-handed parallel beta-helix repeat-containing protein [Kiritimatiellia bacterium]|nr:right-handed parallel beta-helix repeat-containing protein [Kiritimatiellia bacterium]HPS08037.1 right-handed parallel beta-helix repeat-containing protein [Kiritimatiellia bacterium]